MPRAPHGADEGRGRRSVREVSYLVSMFAGDGEVNPPAAGEAFLVGPRTQRYFLAEADGPETGGGHAQGGHALEHRLHALLTQPHVVLGIAAGIAVRFEAD